jgi:serine-type D-Ala-D-Ala carboxypeptidase/endopeptidase (penicillin-binding protein 4)
MTVRGGRATLVAACAAAALVLASAGSAVAASSSPSPFGSLAASGGPLPSGGPGLTPPPAVPSAVLPPATGSTATPPAGQDARLAAGVLAALSATAVGPSVSAAVLDVGTGTALVARGASMPVLPASTLKLLTAAAVLRGWGTQARLRTTVVSGAKGQVVLVGAGDATLSRRSVGTWPAGMGARPASLADLAAATAKALTAAKRTSVAVAVDDSLFTGPRTAPGWPSSYLTSGVIAPVTALSVDQGRSQHAVGSSPRVPDPSIAAGRIFASLLASHGIKVTGTVVRASAPRGAAELAAVQSPPMVDLVERMLTQSDDDLAEALGHLAGAKLGGAASFAGGSAAVMAALKALGVPTTGLLVVDCSGLSRRDRLTADVLVHLLAAIAADGPTSVPGAAAPASVLWPASTGLAVAAVNGTLVDRFLLPADAPGRGIVRAKTGTLTGVDGLAGLVRAADGRLLAFAFLDDKSPGPKWSARAALDRAATVVATGGAATAAVR